jgi:rod shape determining protein RodA
MPAVNFCGFSVFILNNMERKRGSLVAQVDWATVILVFLLVLAGWLNIFAVVYAPDMKKEIWDLSLNSGKQLLWIGLGGIIIFFMLVLDVKIYYTFAYPVYGLTLFLLVAVIIFGREIQGSKSWFDLGFMRFQPAELAKYATALALARYLSEGNRKLTKLSGLIPALVLVALPAIIIKGQNETGSALVFAAFLLVLYREGLSDYIMLAGVLLVALFMITLFLPPNYFLYTTRGLMALAGVAGIWVIANYFRRQKLKNPAITLLVSLFSLSIMLGVSFFVNKVLQPHQRKRIEVFINPDSDPHGVGWQVTQSKIAIGSGGLWGKGFLEGTQTKFDFVPDQSTDFIFCTIGEEHGLVGTSIVIILFVALLLRLIVLAERQKTRFAKVYGYCVVSILLFHFVVNIGMTIGLFPVIGIPLPFFSYGGSALWSFTVLLFSMVKLDTFRRQTMIA